ncbi:hypothetical protein ONZ45_g18333 [Pleurotus djamor]|nr:hypothetical protein ONZ45_g18333 [Pleurotus djamor]
MLKRILDLYPAVTLFLQESEQSDLMEHLLSKAEILVVQDILQVLEVAHFSQELLSAELTPTLSLALPVYEVLINSWRILQTTIPELSRHIAVGISKLEEYVRQARTTRIYAHAMVLNPAIKFSWIQDHWSVKDADQAQAWVEESMLQYRQAFRQKDSKNQSGSLRSLPLPRSQSETTVATRRQTAGYKRLLNLDLTVRHSSSMSSLPNPSPGEHGESTSRTLSTEETEAALVEDRMIVHHEIERYKAEIYHENPEYKMVNLLNYWELKQYEFPHLFPVAMDVLPTQASSVPCERIFSSSKETCTLRRNRFRPELLEALQVLKFSFKHNTLSFVEDYMAKEVDYTITGPVTEAARRELKKTGCLEELEELERNVEDHM